MSRSQSKRPLARSRTDAMRVCLTWAKSPNGESAFDSASRRSASCRASAVFVLRSLTWLVVRA